MLYRPANFAQIVNIANSHSVAFLATGIWTGLFFGVAGALGLVSVQKPTKCT